MSSRACAPDTSSTRQYTSTGTAAPRFTNSAEVQLVYLLESILGPLWVWLVIRETPSLNTLIGGSLLLLSVAWFAHHTLREGRA